MTNDLGLDRAPVKMLTFIFSPLYVRPPISGSKKRNETQCHPQIANVNWHVSVPCHTVTGCQSLVFWENEKSAAMYLVFNIVAKPLWASTDPLKMILVFYLKRFIWGWFPIWVFRASWKASFLSEGDTNKVALSGDSYTLRHLATHFVKLHTLLS